MTNKEDFEQTIKILDRMALYKIVNKYIEPTTIDIVGQMDLWIT